MHLSSHGFLATPQSAAAAAAYVKPNWRRFRLESDPGRREAGSGLVRREPTSIGTWAWALTPWRERRKVASRVDERCILRTRSTMQGTNWSKKGSKSTRQRGSVTMTEQGRRRRQSMHASPGVEDGAIL
jgi:hypothetical protein